MQPAQTGVMHLPDFLKNYVFTFYPLINTFGIAFLKDYKYLTGANKGFTFDNFGYVLGLIGKKAGGKTLYMKDVVQYAIPNTLIVVFVTVPLSIIILIEKLNGYI